MTIILTAITFIVMFGILVAVHEWGHYLAARWLKMGIEEFAIGFGPVLKKLGKREVRMPNEDLTTTEFSIRSIPLGGFVRINGMEPKEDGSEVSVPHGFYSKPPHHRIAVLFAGPFFSVLFGVIMLFGLFTAVGLPVAVPKVAGLSKEMPAMKAGIQLNDRITMVQGKPVSEAYDVTTAIRENLGKEITIGVTRGSQTLSFTMTPVLSKEKHPIVDKNGIPTGEENFIPRIGIEFGSEYKRLPIGAALKAAVMQPILNFERLFFRLTQPQKIIEESTGVVGMVAVTNAAVQSGVSDVLYTGAAISIGLGIANLLPIGMLDGGQIMLATIEMFRRGKRLSFKTQTTYLTAGLAFLAVVFLLITRQDIMRIISPK